MHLYSMIIHRITLKIMVMASLPLALMFTFYLSSQFQESSHLTQSTSSIANQSLRHLYEEHLRTRSHDLVNQLELKFQMMENELAIVARVAQKLIDTPQLQNFGRYLRENKHPYFFDQLTFHPKLQYTINQKGISNTSVHTEPGQIDHKSNQFYMDLYSPMKLILPIAQQYGAQKGWLYVMGPDKSSIQMYTPWLNGAQSTQDQFPGFGDGIYHSDMTEGIIDGWKQWIDNHATKPLAPYGKRSNHETTWSSLYEDSGGLGKMITLYRPLWSKNRKTIEGTVGMDFLLEHIIDWLKQDGVGSHEFSFLAQSDSSILGVPSGSFHALGLKEDRQELKVAYDKTHLSDSRFSPVKKISEDLVHLPEFTMTSFIGVDNKEYILSFRRVRSFHYLDSKIHRIRPEFWTVGILVPTDELWALQQNLSNTIKVSFGESLSFTLLASAILFILTLFLTGIFSYRATRQIHFLNEGVKAIKYKNWDYKVDIVSKDELGDLGTTFNKLTSELKESYQKLEDYTHDLEDKVAERTKRLQESNQKLKELATVDPLTQAYNRLYFDDFLDKSWRILSRDCTPLSIILIDIDFFKQYNDTYGHQKGDECLVAVASALNQALVRSSDCFARYGGEEFIAVVCQNAQDAMEAANKLKVAVSSLKIPHKKSEKGYVSISLGVSSVIPSQSHTPAQIINQADEALYDSKKSGRDRATVFHGLSTSSTHMAS